MKIVCFCPNWVGDAVMATPTLRAIRLHYPDATIDAVAKPAIRETLAGNPWINNYLVPSELAQSRRRTWPSLLSRLRRERYDLGVLFPGGFGSAAICWLGGVKRRVGYDRELRGVLLTDPLPAGWTLAGYKPSPIIDYYLRLAERLGAESRSRRMELFVSGNEESQAEGILSKLKIRPDESVVALNPGSAFGPAKRWPSDSFSELARRLVDHQHAKVVVLCGPAERELARSIVHASERAHAVHSLADEAVSIGLSKALVRRSSLLVTTDSGPRHFAAAFGTPVVSLFGPTHIAWTETYYNAEIQLQKKVPCGPCQQRTCPRGHHRCMKELTVGEVYSASVNAMNIGRPIGRVG